MTSQFQIKTRPLPSKFKFDTVYEIIMSNGGDQNLEDKFGQTPAINLRNRALFGHLIF